MNMEDFYKALGVRKEEAFKAKQILIKSPYRRCWKTGLLGDTIDGDIDEIIRYIRAELDSLNEKEAKDELETQEQKQKQSEREDAYNAVLDSMFLTSGYSFEGYKISRYYSVIAKDAAISISRGIDGGIWHSSDIDVQAALTRSLSMLRENALRELKIAAHKLGCNAIIGVKYDYMNLDPETANSNGGTTYYPYVFCVTASGTAVIIEKE